jgi:hypothetical protein
MNDLELLRRYEPIARFTQGEQFFPMNVERYLAACSLWVQRPNEPPEQLVARGMLDAALLAAPRQEHPGAVYYLSFVDPVGPATVRAFYRNSTLRDFRAGRGRLARVGLFSRVVDVLFSVTLLARGRVPGGLAVAAALAYQQLEAERPGFCYYGRVTRQHGYVVLQYWLFYAFNDWRSSFYGVNDHESDWEMISVYLAADEQGALEPRWVAFSSHEFFGDDLRRRWDDPELERDGDHPVLYVAAGSHANMYRAGEYLPVTEIPYTAPLVRALLQVRRTWNRLLRQASEEIAPQEVTIFRIPFVDYARGDGISIGPGESFGWEARLLDPPPPWLSGYRGLWGLFTRDPTAGEDAPAGPMFDRDGTPRRMWFDPVGWAGLDKVPPPLERLAVLDAQRIRHNEELRQLAEQIDAQTAQLMALQTEIDAIYGAPHLRLHLLAHRRELRVASRELGRLKERAANLQQLLDALDAYEARMEAGDAGPMRAHIRVPQQPVSPAELRLSRIAETWSALSSGLLLIGFVALFTLTPQGWLIGLLALIGVYALVEALFRRQAQLLLRNVVVSLATISALILAFTFLRELLIGAVLAIGLLIIVENVRELRT